MIPAFAAAQTESGKITGTVTDQSGAVLPGVNVIAKSVERASTRSTVTNAQGEYVFAGLVPGQYELTAELSGFSTKQTRTTVGVGAHRRRQHRHGRRPADRGRDRRRRDRGGHQHLDPGHRDHGQRGADPRAADDHPQPVRPRPALRARRPGTRSRTGARATRSTAPARRAPTSCSTARRTTTTSTPTVGRDVPARLRAGVLRHHVELLGPVRPRLGRRRERGHEVRHEPVPRDRLRVLPQRRLSANTFDNNANGIEQGKFDRHQMGFSLGGPVVKDKVHFFASGEYIRVRSTDTRDQLDPDAGAHRGERPRDPVLLQRLRRRHDDQRPDPHPRRRLRDRGNDGRRVQQPARPACRSSAASTRRCRSTRAAATRRTSTRSSAASTSASARRRRRTSATPTRSRRPSRARTPRARTTASTRV